MLTIKEIIADVDIGKSIPSLSAEESNPLSCDSKHLLTISELL
jgi:hypothetical protein